MNNKNKEQANRIIPSIYERDIDLLIIEELFSSKEFQDWFAQMILRQISESKPNFQPVNFLYANHSVVDSLGESDFIATYSNKKDQKLWFMVEDKINAALMPNQAERYKQRGEREKKSASEVIDFVTILIAPKNYFGDSTDRLGFDTCITYEQLRDWFIKDNNERAKYKAKIIDSALEKITPSGFDQLVTDFCLGYWSMVKDRLPELNMPDPGKRKRGGTWLHFSLTGKQYDCYILHKLEEGKVDMHFSKMSNRLDELKTKFGAHLVPGMKIFAANDSGTIHLPVPRLDIARPFDEQIEAAYQGAVGVLRMTRVYENGINNIAIKGR